MTDLPPAAQAVLKAVQATLPDYMLTDRTAGCFAAAALQAAAVYCTRESTLVLMNLAAELEGSHRNGNNVHARAALAEQPVVPTDDQIDELWDKEAGYYELYEEVRNVVHTALDQWGQS